MGHSKKEISVGCVCTPKTILRKGTQWVKVGNLPKKFWMFAIEISMAPFWNKLLILQELTYGVSADEQFPIMRAWPFVIDCVCGYRGVRLSAYFS